MGERDEGLFLQLGVSEKGVLFVDPGGESGKVLKKHVKLSTVFSHGFVESHLESNKDSFIWFTVGNPKQVTILFHKLP